MNECEEAGLQCFQMLFVSQFGLHGQIIKFGSDGVVVDIENFAGPPQRHPADQEIEQHLVDFGLVLADCGFL